MDRRTLLAGVGIAGLAGLSGCLDDVTEHEASAYGVDPGVASEAGYDQTSIDAVVIEEPVGIGPFEETVVAINYVVEYEKTVEIPVLGERRAGVFVTFATPQVSVLGQEFNPVADMGTEALVELVQDNYDGLRDITHDEDDEIVVLDETVTRSRFEASATFDGTSVDVDLHVTEVAPVAGDLIATVGVYPTALRDREERHTLAMIEAVDPDAADSTVVGNGGGDDGTGDDGDGGNGEESDDDEERGDTDDGDDGDADDGDDGGIVGY